MKRILLITALVALIGVAAVAQGPETQSPGRFSGSMLVAKVKAVNQDSLIVAPVIGGDPVTVKISEKTRISKERQLAKLADIKAGDLVLCRGELADKSLQAVSVSVPDPEMAQSLENPEMARRIQQGGGRAVFGGMGGPGMGNRPGMGNPEDLGKKFIVGRVEAINETKLTIARPDGQKQDIEVDESTSFKKANESITFPDIKTGDVVRGVGELKNGVFVPKELMVFHGQMRMFREGPSPDAGEKPQPPTQAPPKN